MRRGDFIALALFALFGGAAAWGFGYVHEVETRVAAWRKTILVDEVLRPGQNEFSLPFTSDCGREHGLFLIFLPAKPGDPPPSAEGDATVLTADEERAKPFRFTAEAEQPTGLSWWFELPKETPYVYMLWHLEPGNHTLVLKPDADSLPVRVQLRYHLCGCELLPALIGYAAGWGGLFVLAALLLIWGLPRLIEACTPSSDAVLGQVPSPPSGE